MEQKDLKATELDRMTSSYDLQMLKAALTYFPPQPKRFLSVFVKMQELKNTLNLISSAENDGFLNICSTPEDVPKQGFFDILNEIKEYGSPEQQKMFDRMNQAIKLAGMYEQMAQTAAGSQERSNTYAAGPEPSPEDSPAPESDEEFSSDLAAASLKETASSQTEQRQPDFRAYIRESLSPEDQVLFDSYSAMFHSQNSPFEKER